jgi:hypothetical protein
MPFEERWFIENDAIYVRIYGDLNLEQTQDMVTALLDKTNASSAALVHVLLDIAELGAFPRNLAALNQITRPHLTHPKYGWALAFGQKTPVMQFVGNTLMQMTRTRFRMFLERDEAIEFLMTRYPDLRAKLPDTEIKKPE